MVEPELFPPVIQMLEHLEASTLHSFEHQHQASFDTDAAVLELSVLMPHIQALLSVLSSESNASAFQSFTPAVPWPSPAQMSAPRSKGCGVHDWSRLPAAVGSAHIDAI